MKQTILSFILALLPIMASADATGTCGENLTWSYEGATKTLTISGTGEMNNYWSTSSVPWYSYSSSIKNAIIESGVTSIGSYAFYGCSVLTSVTLPNNLTSIGNYAFQNCGSLTSVTIPNSVTSIGSSAFYYCSGLTSVTIPNSVTSIGSSAFYFCSGLTSVTIGNNVTSIGEDAFYGCRGLTSVTIPNSVTSIGYRAFYYCSGLTSVIIGSGVTSIGYSAFSETNLKKTIWLTNTPPSGYGNASGTVNYVSNDQFSSLSNVTKYQFLSSYFEVDGIRYVPISPSEKTCDAIDCVYNESAKDTKIASTVSYKGVTLNVKNIKPYVAYNNPYIETLTVDNNGAIAEYTFYNCKNMKSASIGAKVTSIGTYAFSGCSSLQSIVIPDAVLTLGNYAFSGCLSMNSVKIGNGLTALPNHVFSSCNALTSITIPKGVTTINNYVFSGCIGLKSVIIADRETELSLGSNGSSPLFTSCPLETVYIGGNINYQTTSSYGYSPFYRNTSLKSVEITDKETEISENEFYGCTSLQRVTIGDGITAIGNRAFSGCSSLQYFAFGSKVANIGQEAFSDCAAVTEIISKATTPPTCGTQALDDINKWDCKLYVPTGTQTAYSGANQWKDFFFSEEGTGTATQNPEGQPETGKCETPTITVKDGKIHFACATEGVTFTYNVSAVTPSGVGNDVSPSALKITVYASKPGYEMSDAATTEITGGAAGGIRGDLTGDGIVNVADHVELSNIIMNQNK